MFISEEKTPASRLKLHII